MDFSKSSHIQRSEKVQETGLHLLEEAWFFGNPLDTKTKTMSECYSDLCSSSNGNQGIPVKKSKNKIPKNGNEFVSPGLIRTPSLPTFLGAEEFSREKERFAGVKKSSSRPKLARAPSLPPCVVAGEEEDDQESEFNMGRLIRQASLNSSQMLPPKQNSKVMSENISIPREQQRPRKKAELQSTKMEGCKDGRTRNPIQTKGNNVEFEELKGFKDLDSKFEKEDMKMNPGLTRVDQMGLGELRRKQEKPWRRNSKSQSPPPSITGWADKSSAEDMKKQIKFWARAVASNVRQEC